MPGFKALSYTELIYPGCTDAPRSPMDYNVRGRDGALIRPGGPASVDCHVKRHKAEAAQGRGGL